MKRLFVVVGGLVVAWFFGLLALAFLGIIAAIATPIFQPSHHIAAVHAPNTTDLIGHQIVGLPQGGDPVATQVVFNAIKSTGLDPELTVLFVGVMSILLFLAAFVILWRITRRTTPGNDADSQTVQELHRQAQELARRMESLETILLERSRPIS